MQTSQPDSLRQKFLVAAVALAAVVTSLVFCRTRSGAEEPYRRAGLWTGGQFPYRFTLSKQGAMPEAAQSAFDKADDALASVDQQMNAYAPNSNLARLNAIVQGRPVMLEEDLWFVLESARRVSEQSNGAFDPTCRLLFELWKHSGQAGRLPDDAQISDSLSHAGWDKLLLDGPLAMKTDQQFQIDLGGIAKGYAADWVLEEFRRSGSAGALVEIAGHVAAFGQSPGGGPWRVGIVNPFDPTGPPCGVLLLTDRAVATSGNYERFTEIDGRRYSHIVDPRTGWPVDYAPSVTVIAPDALTADAWATALSVLGEEGLNTIEQLPDIEAMVVTGTPQNHQIHYSCGFQQFIDKQNPVRLP